MALPAIADVADLGTRLGRTLTGADEARAQAVLDDVSAVARKKSGDSQRWASEAAPDDVVAVVLTAARRLFTNPSGFASEQDGDYSYRLDSASITGGVFTEAELELLYSYRGTSELWTMQTSGSREVYPTNLLDAIHDATFS